MDLTDDDERNDTLKNQISSSEKTDLVVDDSDTDPDRLKIVIESEKEPCHLPSVHEINDASNQNEDVQITANDKDTDEMRRLMKLFHCNTELKFSRDFGKTKAWARKRVLCYVFSDLRAIVCPFFCDSFL